MRRALERAKGMGFDNFYIGPELEYFYFRSAETSGDPPEVLDKGGYFDLTTLDAGSDLRRETVLALEQLGIHVEYSHHEVGPSQHEVDMRYADALKMSDDCMTYRITVKEYAMKYGFYATFMPKPLYGENGSGMHVHQSLFKGGRNAFYDANDQYYLSDVAKSFIAGQLKHAREMSALFAQWVNSYKRLVPGYEAPVYVAWSRRNRSALIRVPLYHPGKEQATRCEIRCPDPACNPYLCFAGLLQAGLEGIEKGYELPEPMERNLYHLSPDERSKLGIEQLPETLGEAIEIAAESELILKTLGEHVFTRFVEIKRQEWEDYRTQLSRGSWRSTCRSCRGVVHRPIDLAPGPMTIGAGPARFRHAPDRAACRKADWPAVREVYAEGIATGQATFEERPPSWEEWDRKHLDECRLVARRGRARRRVGRAGAGLDPRGVPRRRRGEPLRRPQPNVAAASGGRSAEALVEAVRARRHLDAGGLDLSREPRQPRAVRSARLPRRRSARAAREDG